MKAYFTMSLEDPDNTFKDLIPYVKHIYDVVRESGHKIDDFNYVTDPMFNVTQKEDSELVRAFNKAIKLIKESDYIIAELTRPSAAVGFEIAYALGEKKPVLVLYNEEKLEKLSTPFRGNKSKYIRIRKYSSQTELKNAIKFFLDDIKDLIDSKFILIIPAIIDRYLEWNVKERGLSKAEVTRNAIEAALEDDKEYKEAIKGDFED